MFKQHIKNNKIIILRARKTKARITTFPRPKYFGLPENSIRLRMIKAIESFDKRKNPDDKY